jgi:hypothetical protein
MADVSEIARLVKEVEVLKESKKKLEAEMEAIRNEHGKRTTPSQLLSTLITDCNRCGTQYALTGGWAYRALVKPRATTDIDLQPISYFCEYHR